METEFGLMAAWTADAVREIGSRHAIPAACRGSAGPAMLRWLARECRLRANTLMVDVGGGLGGPAAFAQREYGVRALVLEPMPEASREARVLLGVPGWTARGDALPLADRSADAAWCLGVLCTTPDRTALLAEIARVLKPGARLGVLVFTADVPRPRGAPEGNDFPQEAELPGLLGDQGLEMVSTIAGDLLHDRQEGEWRQLADEVEARVRQRHRGDRRLDAALEQERRIGRLLKDGVVRPVLISAERRTDQNR
ncbi:class I SAM-dependent methyltransferase [Kineosporia succinea]